MKNLLLFIALSITLLFYSCSSDPADLAKLQNRDGLYYQINATDPYDGDAKHSYSNGEKETTGEFKDGLKHGMWTTWYEGGQKRTEGSYEDGLKTGEWKYWEKNGQLITSATFVKGIVRDNEIIQPTQYKQSNVGIGPTPNATNTSQPQFSSSNSSHTSTEVDHNNPTKKTVTKVKAIRMGLLKPRVRNGALRKLYNGKPYTGKVIDYHNNGKTKFTGWYSDGLRTGEWRYYSMGGQLENVKHF